MTKSRFQTSKGEREREQRRRRTEKATVGDNDGDGKGERERESSGFVETRGGGFVSSSSSNGEEASFSRRSASGRGDQPLRGSRSALSPRRRFENYGSNSICLINTSNFRDPREEEIAEANWFQPSLREP